jgi:hypothetical protein
LLWKQTRIAGRKSKYRINLPELFDNNISSLNVDQNTALAMLDCSDNDLTTLDVSQNTLLEELYCAGNRLNFATLPQAKTSYSDYSFAPQQNLVATCTNGIVDLSSQLTAIGYIGTTEYKWFWPITLS